MAAAREGKEGDSPMQGSVADGGAPGGVAGLIGDFESFETRMKHTTRVGALRFLPFPLTCTPTLHPCHSNAVKRMSTS